MEIKYYEDKYLDSLNELLWEAFQVAKTYKNISNDIELVMIKGEEVVGYLNLNKGTDLVTGEVYFCVNYVCVKKNYRRQGIATELFKKVFEICKELEVTYLELTSNSSRVAAHELYKKLGFVVRETTIFRRELI